MSSQATKITTETSAGVPWAHSGYKLTTGAASSNLGQLGAHSVQFSCSAVQFSSVAQSWLTLCDPVNRSTPGLPVHHQLLEFTQTHIHRVSDAIQPSYPLSSPSPPAPSPRSSLGVHKYSAHLYIYSQLIFYKGAKTIQ